MSQTTGVFISLAGEDRILSLLWRQATGVLEPLQTTPTGSRPAPLAVSRNRQCLYVGLRGSRQIALFQLSDPAGTRPPHLALTPSALYALPSDPCYLGIDRSGQWLMAAYYGAGAVTVHAIQPDGTLSPTPVTHLQTGPKAHCIRCNQVNDVILVPHVGSENSIHQFHLDAASGRLRPLGRYAAAASDWIGPEGPRHYVYHEPTHSVYFANEHASSVTHYRFDARGISQRVAAFSTVPIPCGRANTCAQIHLTPDARFLYVSNRGHNSLAVFRVDTATGHLTPAGWRETEPMPRAFAILPDGSHLLAGGLESASVSVYAINAADGSLTLRTRQRVGAEPMWILPIAMG